MQWLLAQAENVPDLTPEEWMELQRNALPWWFWWGTGVSYLFWILSSLFSLWMIIYCIRNDSERSTWLWILFFFPGMGPVTYFFARWLPSSSFEMPAFFRRWTDDGKNRRLEAAAHQIGNPYQFVEWGDALRTVKNWSEASQAYRKAIAKEPQNLPAWWGLANALSQLGDAEGAKEPLEQILKIDPAYKFGDVSLLYGRTLHVLSEREAELAHWRLHLKRWRQPEALYSLAERLIERGEYAEARQLLQSMIADIEITPRALARKVFFWKGRGKKLLRKIPQT